MSYDHEREYAAEIRERDRITTPYQARVEVLEARLAVLEEQLAAWKLARKRKPRPMCPRCGVRRRSKGACGHPLCRKCFFDPSRPHGDFGPVKVVSGL